MSNRNDILAEMQTRLNRASVKSVRNPTSPPSPADYPITSIITGPASFFDQKDTGEFPDTRMDLVITLVPYLVGSDGTDETAESELEDYMLTVIKAIFGRYEDSDEGDSNLGGLCYGVAVRSISDLIKPYAGQPGVGVQVDLLVRHGLFD